MYLGDTSITNFKVGDSQVAKICLGTDIVWPDINYSAIPLTFEILSAGTIKWAAYSSSSTRTIQYSKDNGSTWTNITSSTAGASINVNAGDKVMFRGDNASYADHSSAYNTFSGSTASFNAYGNIMSLISSTNFSELTALSSSYTFYYLFKRCTSLISAENLVLPAMTLTDYCYTYMFVRCTSLTIAPELPATTLAKECYEGMFERCTSLTQAPALPATTLGNYSCRNMFASCSALTTAPLILPATSLTNGCYQNMFLGCTSLTTAPELPAKTLAYNSYDNMFTGCTNLNYIKCLATDISASDCTRSWLNGVSSTGTFVKDASMTGWPSGASGIPTGWTVENA